MMLPLVGLLRALYPNGAGAKNRLAVKPLGIS
jgi:hypothetical protein